jgi:lanosterol synthase
MLISNVKGTGNGHADKRSIGSHVDRQVRSTRTDYSRWRLRDERGRQTWEYLETDEEVKEWPQSTADKYFLGLPTVCTPLCRALDIYLIV